MASIGGGQPIELFGRKLTASWSVQLHHLLARDVNKSKESKAPVCNPGVTALCDEIADDTPHPETGALEPSFEGLQTGNPGFPGWISSGMLLAVGLDLTWSF